YIRVEPNSSSESNCDFNIFSNYHYDIPCNRIILEEVKINIPILYRDKIINLINYMLEEGDLLIVSGIDCLGSNFEEILYLVNLIDKKNIKFICLDYSKMEIEGNLKLIFQHFLKICLDYEMKLNQLGKSQNKNLVKRVGRPEILNSIQKEEVIEKFKKGYSVYSLAKEYSVTRTVIQRILDKLTINNGGNCDVNFFKFLIK
ncbi:resolvase, partial [Acinetobacter baumannii]|uniref:resolvase n=1 Tax=Acinetobacter baumannii TaxID=470 RepID=UPI0038B4E864